MKPIHKRQLILILAAGLQAILLSACLFGGSVKNSASTPEAKSTLATPVTPASGGSSGFITDQGINGSAFSSGKGNFDLLNPAVGLDQLDSYHASLTIRFDGQQGGQAKQWSHTYNLFSSKKAIAFRETTIESNGQVDEGVPAKQTFVETGGTRFTITSDSDCQVTIPVKDRTGEINRELAFKLQPLRGAVEAGTDTLDGQTARRVNFDAAAMGIGDLAKASGEAMVAQEGGYLLKYQVKIDGGPDYFGEDLSGTETWEYTLKEVNQSLSLSLPQSCPPGKVDAPLIPDAKDASYSPGLTTFQTASSTAEVVSFYQEKLTADGWMVDGQPGGPAEVQLLSFLKGSLALDVIAIKGDQGTTVWLVVGAKMQGMPSPP